MQFSSSFVTEFLSETNLVLTQENYANKLDDLVIPIHQFFNKEKELLSFSLARYCGANSRLAFIIEWYFQTTKITFNPDVLLQENLEYFHEQVPEKYQSLKHLDKSILRECQEYFLPKQIGFLHSKVREFHEDLVVKHPYLMKYLNSNYLSQIQANEIFSHKKLYSENLDIGEFLEAQNMRLSFAGIALPCLLSFTYAFNQEEAVINPDGVKWGILEDILKQIATLHQIGQDPIVANYIYITKLGQLPELEWLDIDDREQLSLAVKSNEVKEILDKIKTNIYENSQSKLEQFVFPDKYKEMISELLNWAKNIDYPTN